MGVFKSENPSLELIYPVGSLYFTTANICPLEKLGVGTWKNVGTHITTATSGTVSIKGNGKGIYAHTEGNANDQYLEGIHSCASPKGYNIRAHDNILQNTNCDTTSPLRWTTDAGKSGLTGSTSLSNLTVNIFQRIA